MLAGYDANGPQLYQIDPSGTFFAWKASAIGKNMVNAKTFLEKRYADDLELEDAIDTALLTLKESFEGEMSGDNVEVWFLHCQAGRLGATCYILTCSTDAALHCKPCGFCLTPVRQVLVEKYYPCETAVRDRAQEVLVFRSALYQGEG